MRCMHILNHKGGKLKMYFAVNTTLKKKVTLIS